MVPRPDKVVLAWWDARLAGSLEIVFILESLRGWIANI